MAVRDYWRVTLLAVLVLGSSFALFAPGVNAGGSSDADLTNLEYGLDLSGGTRVRAPVIGSTATGVDVSTDNQGQVTTALANELDLRTDRVKVRAGTNVVEVYAPIEEAAFRDALEAVGLSADTVRQGVTEATRETIVSTLSQKITAGGLSGGTVTVAQASDEYYIVIEVPDADPAAVRDLVTERGNVYISAYFPKGNQSGSNDTAYRRETLLTQDEFLAPGSPTQTSGQWAVPVTLTQSGAENFSAGMRRYGFTTHTSQCFWGTPENGTGDSYCLLTVLDGEVVYSAGVEDGLARDIESGAFTSSPTFVITATNFSQARQLQVNLQAGALPAPLDITDRGTVSYISPSRAESFKLYSLLAGLVAVLAVSFVVYLRYSDPVVAVPMVFTALSEVVILMGFSAGIQYTINLPVIAGFIAVIGTGVDDLIIIADEVMAEEVRSNRVFKSRFRKALWVIGAAAVTTIIAMSPLTVLSLGDLSGFAIITILGVLVGVIVTRPAYGDILRTLLTRR